MDGKPLNSMAELDEAYDTDNISITSTVSSTKDTHYDAKAVLSERSLTADDSVKEYLIEWEGYPMHRCTWEPEGHLEETKLLQIWARKRKGLGEAAHQGYMRMKEAEFQEAQECFEHAKSLKRALRKKKRAQLKGQVRHFATAIGSDSEVEVPSRLQRQHRTQPEDIFEPAQEVPEVDDSNQLDSLFVNSHELQSMSPALPKTKERTNQFSVETPSLRNPPVQQSDSSSTSVSSEAKEVCTPNDFLTGGLFTGQSKERSMVRLQSARGKELGPLKSVQPTKSQAAFFSPQGQAPLTVSNSAKAKRNQSLTRPSLLHNPSQSNPVLSNPQTKMRGLKSMRRTEPSKKSKAGIRIVNEPKIQPTPWQNSDKPFSTLKFRRIAEKRARTERAPELGDLSFVDPPPPGFMRASARMPNDDIYGRRETGTRQILQSDVQDASKRTSIEKANSIEDWGADKIPMVCLEWRLSNSCKFGERKCRFLHRHQDASGCDLPLAPEGHVPPKYQNPSITCRYWLLDPHSCKRSDADCKFAHKNTGYFLHEGRNAPDVIEQKLEPVSQGTMAGRSLTCPYWLFQPTGCIMTREQCRFAHANTGAIADRHGQKRFTVLDLGLKPVSESSTISPSSYPGPRNMHPSEVTCYFWSQGRCKKRPEECIYQHRDTGIIAPPPSSLSFSKWPEGNRCHMSANKSRHSCTGNAFEQHLNDFNLLSSSPHSQSQHDCHPEAFLPETESLVIGTATRYASQHLVMEECNLEGHPATIDEASTANQSPPLPQPLLEAIQADITCTTLDSGMERYCRLDFSNIFTRNDRSALLDQRAFLLYHPEKHAEEVEIITRWLLMHHIEVGSAWYEGSWDRFAQHILEGGSGVVIAHPEFEYFMALPRFGRLLEKQVRLWSVGLQDGMEHDPNLQGCPAKTRHDCIEIFPHGGFIYITDEVFEQKPQLASRIIERFCEKITQLQHLAGPISPWHTVDDACLLWRLCVRPELAEHMFQLCEDRAEELEAGDLDVTSYARLYKILVERRLVETSTSIEPLTLIPDRSPILSEHRIIAEDPPLAYFTTLARSQEEANFRMIRYYSLSQIDMRREYRHFFVVHTEPTAIHAQQWKSELQNLAAVISPEECIEELEKDGHSSRFNFCESYMPGLHVKSWKKFGRRSRWDKDDINLR